MRIIFSASAFRQLSKLDKQVRKRIIDKLNFYVSRSNPLESAEKLSDIQFGDWKFRIGDYRVIFDVASDKIEILKIGHRKDVYK